ncbi:MAG: hypothetical protein WAW42_19655 [Candidatus Competibacteraceae bacterium]
MQPLIPSLLAGLLLAMGSAPQVMAQEDPSDRPLWLRYPAVSPDGQHIAFVYGGQLWRVPAAGGEALPLTSAEFIASNPVWSPDSRSIVFSANRHGNADVFIMPAKGGEIRRLTTHSQADTPQAFTPDGKSVYFGSVRLDDAKKAHGGYNLGEARQLYSVPVAGGREQLVIPLQALDVAPTRRGDRRSGTETLGMPRTGLKTAIRWRSRRNDCATSERRGSGPLRAAGLAFAGCEKPVSFHPYFLPQKSTSTPPDRPISASRSTLRWSERA